MLFEVLRVEMKLSKEADRGIRIVLFEMLRVEMKLSKEVDRGIRSKESNARASRRAMRNPKAQ